MAAQVAITTDVKIVAIVLGICVLFAVLTVIIVAFFYRPARRRLAASRGAATAGGDDEASYDGEMTETTRPSTVVVSSELEDRAINRDGSNMEPRNMIPKYE